MNELSDSIAWPSRDPQWVSKVLLNGLILLIPIVGGIVVFGWMLAALDNLRAGRRELPPAGLSYIGRGVNLWVVSVCYIVAVTVVFLVLFGAGLTIEVASSGRAGVLAILLILVAYALLVLAGIGLTLMVPAIVVATERGGIGGGLNLPGVIRLVRADVDAALRAGLFAFVANLIGSVGALACGIGQYFTTPYGYAVLAGVVHHYERRVAAPMPPPA